MEAYRTPLYGSGFPVTYERLILKDQDPENIKDLYPEQNAVKAGAFRVLLSSARGEREKK